jgi:hypothetical protein
VSRDGRRPEWDGLERVDRRDALAGVGFLICAAGKNALPTGAGWNRFEVIAAREEKALAHYDLAGPAAAKGSVGLLSRIRRRSRGL